MLSDPQICRAFAEMAAHPGSNHTVVSLADTACLSRSQFYGPFCGGSRRVSDDHPSPFAYETGRQTVDLHPDVRRPSLDDVVAEGPSEPRQVGLCGL